MKCSLCGGLGFLKWTEEGNVIQWWVYPLTYCALCKGHGWIG